MLKNFDDPDAFDDPLAITEEAVDAQIAEQHIGDPPMTLEEALDEIEQLQSAIASWKEEEIEWKNTEERLRARVEELEKEKHPEISVTMDGDKITLYVNEESRPIVPHASGGEAHAGV